MWLYLIIFLLPVIFYYKGSKDKAQEVTFMAIYLAFLAIFVGISDMFGGYDRYIYGEVFDSIADVTTSHLDYDKEGVFDFFKGESGYIWINIIISWFTENRYIFILVFTLIIYFLLFISLKRYVTNYSFALILFLGLWFYFSFTYLRQVMGATVAWLAINYIIERNFLKFFIVWFIAWSIHKSAIIFFPIYFLPIRKFPPKLIIRVMALTLILGFTPIPNFLFSSYGDNSIVEQRTDYNASGGIRIEYFTEAVFFLYFILKNYKFVQNKTQNILLLNMALVFCMILLFFIRSDNGGRLSWYYVIGIIVTLSNIANLADNKKNISIILIFVSLFLFLRVYNSWQNYLNLYPYKTFLTNGYRKGDYSWNYYEYNHNYDYDKFCREPFRWNINIKR